MEGIGQVAAKAVSTPPVHHQHLASVPALPHPHLTSEALSPCFRCIMHPASRCRCKLGQHRCIGPQLFIGFCFLRKQALLPYSGPFGVPMHQGVLELVWNQPCSLPGEYHHFHGFQFASWKTQVL